MKALNPYTCWKCVKTLKTINVSNPRLNDIIKISGRGHVNASMLISLSDNLKYSLNYVTCEYIGTYGYSSKSVALRLKIKQSCWVGIVFSINKPHDNIDDGSTTLLREVHYQIKF